MCTTKVSPTAETGSPVQDCSIPELSMATWPRGSRSTAKTSDGEASMTRDTSKRSSGMRRSLSPSGGRQVHVPQLVPPPGPLRVMATATLVNTFGNGLFYTSAALFYTRSIGLSPGQVGVGLTVAGLAALLVGVPAGHLADLRGARELLRIIYVAEAVAMVGLVLVHSFPGFLLVVTFYSCVDKAGNAVRQGLVASAFPAEERVRGRAYLRSVTNLGI